MKVLNLYAGIGGNRTHWEDCQVTAVEINPRISAFYRQRFPDDEIIIGDAHQYLIDNFKRFDFIWSSVPCQSHSRARYWSSRNSEKVKPVFPDMKLYQEILFLRSYFEGDWVVENVVPYYEPLIEPTMKSGRHLFWSNRNLPSFRTVDLDIKNGTRGEYEASLNIFLGDHDFGQQRTDQVLRNCVHPETGRLLFDYFKHQLFEHQLFLMDTI